MSRPEQPNPDRRRATPLAWVIRQRRRLILLCIAFAMNGGALVASLK